MQIPFSADEFFAFFARYNEAIWPAQVVAYMLAGIVMALPFLNVRHYNQIISGILGLFWVWIGIVFLVIHYSALNGVTAVAFGYVLAFQGLLFIYAGVVQQHLHFTGGFAPSKLLGTFFMTYALFIYPYLGALTGHIYPYAPIFGVAPCPTTIFTFGLLLWSSARLPRYLLAIPLLWSLVGVGAALSLGVVADVMMPVAGVVAYTVIMHRSRKVMLPHHASRRLAH